MTAGALTASGSVVSYSVLDMPWGQTVGNNTLVFEVAAVGDGSVGVRADAEMVPPGARCVSAVGTSAAPGNWLASSASRP